MKKMKRKKPSALWERLKEATPELEEVERSPYFEGICEVGQGSVSRWRTGKVGLNPTHATAISDDTGFCIQYLRRGNGPKRWDLRGANVNEWTDLLDKMSDERREETLRFARFQAQDSTGSDDKT